MRHCARLLPVWLALAAGCDSGSGGAATFARDVAPLVHARCAPCHRPGEAAPFALLTYEDVRRRGRLIREVTASGYMPPWLPESEPGVFREDRSLTPEELATLHAWIDGGMPEGPRGTTPTPPPATPGWQLGEPDLVLRMPAAFTVPAEGRDVYRNFVIPAVPGAPRWIRAVEWRPDNRRVVHHAVLFVDRTGAARALAAAEPAAGYGGMSAAPAQIPEGQFIGWTPGNVPHAGDGGIAWRLDDLTDVVLQLHLRPTGRPEPVQVELGLHLADGPPERHPVSIRLIARAIDIPAGEAEYVVTDEYTLPVDVALRAVYPHAHYLAKEMRAWADLPDGERRELFFIPEWNFDWQDEYFYVDELELPRGTVVSMRYTYDNSADNPLNPNDPPRRVVYGEQSSDEMAELMLQVVPATEDLPLLWRDFARKVLADDIEYFRARLAAQPDEAGWHRQLFETALREGRSADAVEHARRWVALRPGNKVLPVLGLGRALVEAGAHDAALTPLRSVLERRPDHVLARVELARALTARGELDAAATELERARAAGPSEPRVHLALGDLLAARGARAEAARAYDEARRLAPDDVVVLARLGGTLVEAGRHEEAVEVLTRAVRLFHQRFLAADRDRERAEDEAHALLGLALEARGDHRAALGLLETATRLAPDNPTYARALARVRGKARPGGQ